MNPPNNGHNGHDRKEQEAIQAIIERASRDADFRRALLTDPRRAIELAYAVTIPPTFRIRFIEKGNDVDALVVLPDFHASGAENGELTEHDLEHVAGGAHSPPTWSEGITG